MTTRLDWGAVVEQLPLLGRGLVFTLEISASGYALALVAGLVVALLRRSPWRPLSLVAFAYTQLFRSLSIYIYIIWVYFGLPVALGVRLSPFAASIVSLLFLHSAYLSEIYRGALDAVDSGQREAATSLGLGRIAAFFEIVLPQALRVAVPQLINQFTMILKDSSVVALIGAGDLMYETIRAANREFRSFEFYTTTGLIYLSIVLVVSGLSSLIERRMRRGFA